MVLFLIKTNLCFSILYLAWLAIFRRSTFYTLQRIYLLSIPLTALLLASIQWTHKAVQQLPVIKLRELVIGNAQALPAISGRTLSMELVAENVYFLISAILLANLGLRLIKIYKLCRHAVYNDQWKVWVARLADFKGAGSFFRVVFLGNDPEKRVEPMILAHEMIHINQFHWLDILGAELFASFNWFNPFAWQLIRAVKLQHEFIADQEICLAFGQKQQYQSLLLKESFSNSHPLEVHSFSKPSTLKLRIMKLNQKLSDKVQYLFYLTLVPIAAGLLLICMLFSNQVIAGPDGHIGSATRTSALLINYERSDTSKVFVKVENPPVYPGGEEGLMSDLSKYLGKHYPEEARKNNVQGRVTVHFIVEKDGSISTIAVLRGKELGGGLAENSVNAVKSLKRFKPGMQQGKPVRVSYAVPITYQKAPADKRTGSLNLYSFLGPGC